LRKHPNPFRFVERALESDAPVWQFWDRDTSGLLSALISIARIECSNQAVPRDPAVRERTIRLMWLLDRLAPEADNAMLEPFLHDPRGVYAWGRRLPPERRQELPQLELPSSDQTWKRTRYLQFLMSAWCDSCPQHQIDSLLDWPDSWWHALLRTDHGWLPSPTREFYRRCNEVPEVRRERVYSAIDKYIKLLSHPDDAVRHQARGFVLDAWLILLRDISTQNPSSEPCPPTPDDLPTWFKSVLSETPFARLAEIDRCLPHSANREHWAKSVWVWRHNFANWKNLHAYALCNPDGPVFDRLAEVTPQDELEAWDDLLIGQTVDNGQMRAFCRWVPPCYAEALRENFNHSDGDWRTCAFLNYLAKAPEPILQHQMRGAGDMLVWQTKLLDRRLFAPECARPAASLEDRQRILADPRLKDPFTP